MGQTQSHHFFPCNLQHLSGLLLLVNPKATQKPGKPQKLHPLRVCTQDKIPVDRETKSLIETTQSVPYAATPEHRLLRNIVQPLDGLAIMFRQQPSSDL